MTSVLESNQKRILAVFAEMERNARWISRNIDELRSEFQDEYVAVFQQHVVEHAKSRAELLEKLKRRPNINDSVAIEFISSKNMKFLL